MTFEVRAPYEDLRTYNNVIFNTFKEAANSRGLLPDDNE
jgi:hypothetical protein